MHGDRTRLWVTSETVVKCADHNPRLIDQATKTLENALRREGMLDQQPVSLRFSAAFADSSALPQASCCRSDLP